MCISLNVLKEIKKDLPKVTKVYMKSDNASCYHGNYSAELNHLICKQEHVKLLRYDFNEPQKGKDQCDREAAPAKNQLRSYVEAGNDIDNDVDIYNALHYAKGLKNSKVCVVDISTKDTKLSCPKTKNVSTYHSISYEDDRMIMRRYYDVGKGITQKYGKCSFESGLSVKMPFHSTEPAPITIASTPKPNSTKKIREDRHLCTLYFCPISGCKGTFEDKKQYDEHVATGIHDFAKECGALDSVKKLFVEKMKSLYSSHELHTSEAKTMQSSDDVSLMSMFSQPGWALPTRNNFRFSYKQKKYLYDQFMEGELSGKKKSAMQVHLDMRKDFKSTEYVKVHQIKSLFSRMSTAKRKGTLTEPVCEGEKETDEAVYANNLDNNNNDNDIDPADLRKTAESILCELTVECEKWVMVLYNEEMFPGIVKKILDDGAIRVTCLEYEQKGKNRFRWPEYEDINDYEYDQIIASVEVPLIVGVSAKNKRKNVYSVSDYDWYSIVHLIS